MEDPEQSSKIKAYVKKAVDLLSQGNIDAKDVVLRFHQIARRLEERWHWILSALIEGKLIEFAQDVFSTVFPDACFLDAYPTAAGVQSVAVIEPQCNEKAMSFHSLINSATVVLIGKSGLN